MNSELNKFVGLWHPSNDTIESMYHFYLNGTFVSTFGARPATFDPWSYGTYEVKDGKIFLKYDNSNETIIWNYSFSENNTILTFNLFDNQQVSWSYENFKKKSYLHIFFIILKSMKLIYR